MSRGVSPALRLRFPDDTTPAARDRLVALLADFDLIAIQEDDPVAPRTWTAHFGSPASRDEAASALGALDDATRPALAVLDVEDEDWARRTQADLPAIRVGRVIVAPPWALPADGAAAVSAGPGGTGAPAQVPGTLVVQIEPSRGFGTGHHQSTRLCLILLQQRDLAGRTVIDVGTGSGVLAIAAAKLGAAYVAAFDEDPDAVENARENIARNAAEGVIEAHVRDLAAAALPPADVVLANLTGTLLARHADDLAPLVRPGGTLIAAGFTADEKAFVLEAFAGRFDLSESAEEDDWWAFVLTRVHRE